MYSKNVINLAEKLARETTLLVTTSNHPMRHVEVGPNGQVFGTDFINERAPKVIATLKLFKDTIIPVLNQTISKIDEEMSNIKTDLNQQDVMSIYKLSDMFTGLERQGFGKDTKGSKLNELTFKEMSAKDVTAMSEFGNGIVKKLSTLTDSRTEYIYNTYIKNMNIAACKHILASDASACKIEDRIDTIVVGYRILNAGIIGGVFTPDNPNSEAALRENLGLLVALQLDFVKLYESESEVLGSIKNGKISLFPGKDQLIAEHNYSIRGLALSHSGYFTVDTLKKDDYTGVYKTHLSIKAIKNRGRLVESRKAVICEVLGSLNNMGSEFTSRLASDAISDAINYVKAGHFNQDITDTRHIVSHIFKYTLFWKLPLSAFMDAVDKLLKNDNTLCMQSAVVLATAELIVSDIMVGIRSVDVGA